MMAWQRILVIALVLLMPAAAPAHGLRHHRAVVSAYYVAPPVVAWYPAYQAFYVVQRPAAPVYVAAPALVSVAPPYAVPRAAPPSSGPVIPNMPAIPETREPPRVSESRSLAPQPAETLYVAEKRPADTCRVGFWNLSNRDLALTIDGQTRTLPRNRSVTLRLGRVFVWQVDGSKTQMERVPVDQTTHEIVIRR
jgi:hypothetical protein